MQSGTIISGGAHAALIGLAFLSGLDFWPTEAVELKVTEVTLVRAEIFDTQTSSAPAMPVTDLSDLELPDTDFTVPVAPLADNAPTETEMDQTAEPDAADANPDLTALLDIVRPDVSNVLDAVIAPSFEDSAPAIFQPAQDGNELNAPPTSLSAPPPRNAPRIDTSAAERPPEDALPSTETTTAVDEGPAEVFEDQQQDATAAPESTTEITPEGQEDVAISAFAPVTAARPPRRPTNFRIPAEEPDRSTEDAILAAIEQADREAVAAAANQPVQAEMTGQERGLISDVVSQKWNKGGLEGHEGFEQYIVVIAVEVNAGGAVESITLLEPSSATGVFEIAFRLARSAVKQAESAGGIPLPEGKFPNGVRLVLRFDPGSGEIGLN